MDPYKHSGYDRDRPDLKKGQKKPSNPRLWNLLISLAKVKFPKYPSIPAQKWIHDEYLRRGGRFVASVKEDDRHTRSGRLRKDRAAAMEKKENDAKKKHRKD